MLNENSKFTEMQNAATESIKNRFTDPLIGNYLLTFCIYNWKIFFYTFSDYETLEKIKLIQNILAFNFLNVTTFLDYLIYLFCHSIILPLWVSLFYIFIYPKFTKKIRKTFLDHSVERKNETYAANEKLTPIELKISDLEQKLSQEIEKNRITNDSLQDKERIIKLIAKEKNQIEENLKILNIDFQNMQIQFNNLKNNSIQSQTYSTLTEFEKKILSIINSSNFNKDRFKNIALNISRSDFMGEPTSANDPRIFIKEFANLGLVIQDNSGRWKITELGKQVLKSI